MDLPRIVFGRITLLLASLMLPIYLKLFSWRRRRTTTWQLRKRRNEVI